MSFKIVFHVMRQNWYRIFSAPIAEALRRGWEVECWHATYSEKILGANSPDINRVPEFAGKQPRIILYQGACELGELIDITSAHAIIDCDISLVPKLCKERERPVTILLDGLSHPILSRLKSGSVKTLPAYDVFALPSKQHMSDIIRCQSEGREEMIKVMHREKIYNIKYLHNFLHSWTALEKKYFINHSVVVGTHSLDDIKLIDPIEVKHRLGIPHDQPIVGVLPSPWDMPMELFCGEFNMSKTICGVIKSILKYKEYNLPLSKIFLPRDKNIMASIMKFCKYNNAFLLTKLRHSKSIKDNKESCG